MPTETIPFQFNKWLELGGSKVKVQKRKNRGKVAMVWVLERNPLTVLDGDVVDLREAAAVLPRVGFCGVNQPIGGGCAEVV